MTRKIIDLASQIIAVPSYVAGGYDERAVVDFLAEYIRTNLPRFDVKLSPVNDSGRSNLYILGKKRPRVVFVGHVDTVVPSGDWSTEPLVPTVCGDRLYGLGAADMKGSIASLLMALQNINPVLLDDIGILLYVDEEYQFAGMKQLIKDRVITKSNQPELVVSLDGGLDALSGCRGLTKIDLEIVGRSGHASNPLNGNNAITGTMDVMRALELMLPEYSSSLGISTMNVARLNGGAVMDTGQPDNMQRTGNVIPNYAECIIELRTASADLSVARVKEMIGSQCAERGLKVKSLEVKIDLGVWPGSFNSSMTNFIRQCYTKAGIKYSQADPRYVGFIDVQMLAETIDSPTYVIGAGGGNRHGADEYVLLENLKKAQSIYQMIVNQLGEYDGK